MSSGLEGRSGHSQPHLFDSDLPLTWPEYGPKPHRFAGIFRMLTGDEKEQLDASVRTHGVKQKIFIYEEAILDGRNRYVSAVDGAVFDPETEAWRDRPDLFVEFTGTAREALDLVWSLNEERRHDEKAERAMAAARRKKLLDELAASDPSIERRTDAQLAEEHGVSERLLNSANKVIEQAAPEVQEAVDAKRMSVTDAALVAGFDKVTQSIIAQYPDRKTIKRAVKEAGKPKREPSPELPLVTPLPIAKFAQFAQSVLNVARSGKGSSIDAGTIVSFAVTIGIVREEGDGFVFTPEALASMGTLAAAERERPAEVRSPMPLPPTVGGPAMEFTVGGLHKGKSASFSIVRPGAAEFYASTNFDFPTRGGAHGGIGPWPSMAEALAAAAGELTAEFEAVAQSEDSVTTDSEKAGARAGLKWFGDKLAAWGITAKSPMDALNEAIAARHPEEGPIKSMVEYERLVAAQGDQKGHHTQASAEAILRAADAAGIKVGVVATDIGASKGSVAGWRGRLGLQRSDRSPLGAGHREGAAA